MNRHIVSIVVVLAVLMVTWTAFGQNTESARQAEQWQNMSEKEKEKFRAEMRQRRQRWENMSEAEREEARAQMRPRSGGFGGRGIGREEQLKMVKAIEDQLAKLKAAVEGMVPATRERLRELSEEARAKLREKMVSAMRGRQRAIRAIEQQLVRLKGSGRPGQEPRERIGELRAIRKLAVKEKATETAKRLDKLIAEYEKGSESRPPRDRPIRRDRQADSGRKATEFTLKSFDGKAVGLSDYKGKIVVLEWFNFECPFSKYHYETKKTMAELAKKYKGKNVVWLAINSTSHTTPKANRDFTAKYRPPFPILDDRSGKVGRAYRARTTPHMYIIDTGSNIVYDGAIDDSPMGQKKEGVVNYVDKALAELTAGKAVSIPRTMPYGCTVKYAQ
jgi:peroxiredoxin